MHCPPGCTEPPPAFLKTALHVVFTLVPPSVMQKSLFACAAWSAERHAVPATGSYVPCPAASVTMAWQVTPLVPRPAAAQHGWNAAQYCWPNVPGVPPPPLFELE